MKVTICDVLECKEPGSATFLYSQGSVDASGNNDSESITKDLCEKHRRILFNNALSLMDNTTRKRLAGMLNYKNDIR